MQSYRCLRADYKTINHFTTVNIPQEEIHGHEIIRYNIINIDYYQ